MKKTLALLLCVAMLFTALSVNVFADVTPTVEIVTHGASVEIDEETDKTSTDFAIKLSNFDSLKGYDLVIESGDGIEITGVTALNAKTTLEAGKNYVISDDQHTLHIVELTKKLTGDIITVTADVVAGTSYEITVTACDLAKNTEKLYDNITSANIEAASITLADKVKSEVTQESTVAQPDDKNTFIPYGSVYTVVDGKHKHISKKADGTFEKTAGATVSTFKLPENGIATYGTTESEVGTAPAKRFGNVAKGYDPDKKDYGTLVFVGNWTKFRDSYLSQNGYSDAELVNKIYAAYKSATAEKKYNFIKFTAADGSAIKVYNVKQFNYMWRNSEMLEYAVDVYGLEEGTEYAAVAYSVGKDGNGLVFSKEIKLNAY